MCLIYSYVKTHIYQCFNRSSYIFLVILKEAQSACVHLHAVAVEIILRDNTTEPVNSEGGYYDEAKVPGTENSNLDEGHVIADSIVGVVNAYNITQQDSVLNRYEDQAYME